MSGRQGYLPCFSRHNDKDYDLSDFYGNSAFVKKIEAFLVAILTSNNVRELGQSIGGEVKAIDPRGNSSDKKLCRQLQWQHSKVYRVDYGKTPYRLCFGLDSESRRCYILALDSKHQTWGNKRHQ